MVFIRPKILRDESQTTTASEEKYNNVREEQKALHKGHITLLPGQTQPVIPPLSPYTAPVNPAPNGRPNPEGAVKEDPAPQPTAPQPTAPRPAPPQ
jgi:hypothetical protein